MRTQDAWLKFWMAQGYRSACVPSGLFSQTLVVPWPSFIEVVYLQLDEMQVSKVSNLRRQREERLGVWRHSHRPGPQSTGVEFDKCTSAAIGRGSNPSLKITNDRPCLSTILVGWTNRQQFADNGGVQSLLH
jgi:hypothetical protein